MQRPDTRRSRSSISVYLHLFPAVLAVGYPWYLAMFFQFETSKHIAGALLMFVLVFSVPGSAFLSLYVLGRTPTADAEKLVLIRLAHLTFASPPLFVILGVFLYLMKINGSDFPIWIGIWLVILCGTILVLLSRRGQDATAPSRVATGPVRVMHGTASLVILLMFLLAHLANHAVGVLGAETHREVMLVLRNIYRSPFIEPALIALFFFQIISGLVLVGPKIGLSRNVVDALQTASGAYLVVFIASHINAVFVLARYFGTETDYAWATGLPKGLLADSWEVRLIPHYALGVWLVLVHIACGLRTVMLAHHVERRTASAIYWALISISTLWAAVIVAGMVGIRV